jgi:hypothetical protein
MSETEKPQTQEACEQAGGTWTDGACVMPQKNETPEETAKALDFNLTQRIENVIKDVFSLKIAALEQRMDTKIEELLKGKEVEMEQALRKGFGLDNDPVIHQSDLVAAIRKAALENSDPAKKTPAPKEKASPEGNGTVDPFDAAVEKAVKRLN